MYHKFNNILAVVIPLIDAFQFCALLIRIYKNFHQNNANPSQVFLD